MAAHDSSEFRVAVIELNDRRHYLMQYRCPITGRRVSRSTGIERTGRNRERDAALKVAGDWEKQLRDGTYHSPGKITWADFRERYENEVLNSLADGTARKVLSIFRAIDKALAPVKLRDLTAARLSHYQATLRARGLSENTIKNHLAHLAAALKWAKRMGLLAVVPNIERTRRAKGTKIMRGRPITLEEFERMLDKVRHVVLTEPIPGEPTKPDPKREAYEAEVVASWKHYLRGLWFSGLRLAESLELYWDRDDRLCIDLTGKRPMMRIPAELEKGHKDRLLPIAPEFAEFLLATPEASRTGHVFNPLSRRANRPRPREYHVCKVISAIGERAGVKVNTDPRTGAVKFASAHDLRRSFGERWATRVMPQVLQELMRHESIDTTLKFYVGRNAQATADVLWAAHDAISNKSGNTDQNTATEAEHTANANR